MGGRLAKVLRLLWDHFIQWGHQSRRVVRSPHHSSFLVTAVSCGDCAALCTPVLAVIPNDMLRRSLQGDPSLELQFHSAGLFSPTGSRAG